MRNPYSILRSILTGALLAAAPAHAEQSAATEWFEHSHERAWLAPYDPTLITRRVLSEFSYERHDDGSDFQKLETTLRWAFPVHKDLAFGMQAMIPAKWTDIPTAEASGVGDLEMRAGFIGRLGPDLRFGAGLNAQFDTASNSLLGESAFILKPILAIRWDTHHRINTGINIEYSFTPRDEGGDDVSALELKFPVTFKLSKKWSASMTYKPRWNLLAETDRHRLALSSTRVFGHNHQYAFISEFEIPLGSESFDFKFITGMAWSF